MRTLASLSLALLLASALAAPAMARKAASTAPGKYTEWNDEIDELEIVSPFKLSDYAEVVVEPFDTSAAPLPDKDDNTYEPVKKVLASITPPFVEGLSGELSRPPVSLARGETGPRALVIRGKVVELDPGSKAARYWGGFGAGAARAQVACEVVDGASGEVLLRFTQERRSGFGVMGGDYVKLMNRNLRQIGEDTAIILKAF